MARLAGAGPVSIQCSALDVLYRTITDKLSNRKPDPGALIDEITIEPEISWA
jgi:hypothetical protein